MSNNYLSNRIVVGSSDNYSSNKMVVGSNDVPVNTRVLRSSMKKNGADDEDRGSGATKHTAKLFYSGIISS